MSEKLYYSIGEVAAKFNVNTSLIRFWEKEFDIIHPHKNKKGNRLFTQKDIDHLQIIYSLVKEQGFTIQGAKDQLGRSLSEQERNLEIKKTLIKIREFLVELRDEIEEN